MWGGLGFTLPATEAGRWAATSGTNGGGGTARPLPGLFQLLPRSHQAEYASAMWTPNPSPDPYISIREPSSCAHVVGEQRVRWLESGLPG